MQANCEPLVSVVTPVFNTDKYLAECIQSVQRQTYKRWEYVILNNRSNDRSLEIAQSFAEMDNRIRVITNAKHLTQMANCNRVFHHISKDSKYCKVIHADDWLFPECLSRMVEVAEAHPSVGIVGSYRLDETGVNLDCLPFPSPCTDSKIIAKNQFLGERYLFGSPSSLLLRSDLIRKRDKFYDESTLHGDKLACYDILRESDFGFVHQVLTFTRRHNESATSFIKKYETYRLGTLKALFLYGDCFFSPEEYKHCLRYRISGYYRFLGRKILERKGFEFFCYHRDELEKIGHKIVYFRLLAAIFWEVLNFRDAVKIVLKRG